MSEPRFFRTQAEWRRWLEANHATATEQVIGFHKAGSGRTGMTRAEAVDEALCFGWIDGLVRGIDADTWTVRFSPRQKRSIWSAVNIARVEALKAAGRMMPAGLAAYEGRDPKLQKRYSFENRDVALDPAYEARFKANPAAWAWFAAKPLSYRRPATWWVMSAVKPETREKRLATLIADSEAGRPIKPLSLPAKRKPA
jgi:uncharacterized protein YdeI (YjbR/CyaY-like superfamily)